MSHKKGAISRFKLENSIATILMIETDIVINGALRKNNITDRKDFNISGSIYFFLKLRINQQ